MKHFNLNRRARYAAGITVVAAATLVACGGGGETGSASTASSARAAAAAGDDMAQIQSVRDTRLDAVQASVVTLTKISETRVSRTVFDYVYKITVQNGSQPQTDVVATLKSVGTGTTIVDGAVVVGALSAGASASPAGTITLRHDRTYAFDPAALAWQVEGNYTNAPAAIKMVWFGITNWHYQVGDIGLMLDGETRNSGSTPNPASVSKALATLKRNGSVDAILVGHDHGDHSVQVPEWAKQTGKQVYAPPTVCTKLVTYGLPASQCTGLLGGEVIKLSDFLTVRAVRWVHSVDCGELSNGTGGPETFGFLVTAQSNVKGKVLNFYVSDSGAGGTDLTTPRVAAGITYGSPLQNLRVAMTQAQLTKLDIWAGGPESRVVNQARIMIPEFHVGTFMPHHLNARANAQSSFNLTYGMHYPYLPEDQPMLKAFLESNGVPQVYPTNYFDAWVYDRTGLNKVDNTAEKADYGLPAQGAGPGIQGPNPRAGDLECFGD